MNSHAIASPFAFAHAGALGLPQREGRPAALDVRRLLFALAWLTTLVGVSMAAAAAFERAGSVLDRGLITAAAVALALGAHLLPALARRLPWAWALWLGCVLATLYGHAHFFTASSQRAGEQRAGAVAPSPQMLAWQRELEAIQSRPLTAVAADQARLETRLSQAEIAWNRCERSTPGLCRAPVLNLGAARAKVEANQVELAQARRAAELRTLLADAAGSHEAQRSQLRQDPVDGLLARWLGVPAAGFGLALSLAQSLLVELLAALLWTLALATGPARRAAGRSMGERTGGVPGWLNRWPAAGPGRAGEAVQASGTVVLPAVFRSNRIKGGGRSSGGGVPPQGGAGGSSGGPVGGLPVPVPGGAAGLGGSTAAALHEQVEVAHEGRLGTRVQPAEVVVNQQARQAHQGDAPGRQHLPAQRQLTRADAHPGAAAVAIERQGVRPAGAGQAVEPVRLGAVGVAAEALGPVGGCHGRQGAGVSHRRWAARSPARRLPSGSAARVLPAAHTRH